MPRVDGRLLRQRVDQRADRVEQRGPVPSGQVRATDRSLEQDVAREHRLLIGERVRDVAGTVPGREHHVDLEPRELETLAALDRVLRVPALERAKLGPW